MVKRSPRVCPRNPPDIIAQLLCLVVIDLVGLVRFSRARRPVDFDLFNRGYLQPTKKHVDIHLSFLVNWPYVPDHSLYRIKSGQNLSLIHI